MKMPRLECAVLSISLLQACAVGCNIERSSVTKPLAPGQFHLTALHKPSAKGEWYLAETSRSPNGCRFEIFVAESKMPSAALFSFSKAAFIRKPGADCGEFLKALGRELGAQHPPTSSPVARLDVMITVLGEHDSRLPAGSESNSVAAGSFSPSPPGPWIAMKVFLANGEGEVYLNLDPTEGIGELSAKDPEYAEVVVNELGKVLLPEGTKPPLR